jgi:hypothetical protein
MEGVIYVAGKSPRYHRSVLKDGANMEIHLPYLPDGIAKR